MPIARVAQYVYSVLDLFARTRPGVLFSAVAVATAVWEQHQINLDVQQVHRGVRYLRDRYPNIPIVTKLGNAGGYTITSQDDPVLRYRRGEGSYVRTRVQTLRNNLDRWLATQEVQNPAQVQILRTHLDRLLEDLGLLVPNGVHV